jgi:hypothetical protein
MDRTAAMSAKGFEELWPLPGAHILQVYTNEVERRHALLDFVNGGLRRGERTFCVHDRPIDECLATPSVQDSLRALACPGPPTLADPSHGDPPAGLATVGPFLAAASRDFYLASGVFDHARIYARMQAFCNEAARLGFHGARILGEVLPELGFLAEGQAVILYETNLNRVIQRNQPTCVVCQYDARAFRGQVLMGILKAHPLVLVAREVRVNPFFEPPAACSSH